MACSSKARLAYVLTFAFESSSQAGTGLAPGSPHWAWANQVMSFIDGPSQQQRGRARQLIQRQRVPCYGLSISNTALRWGDATASSGRPQECTTKSTRSGPSRLASACVLALFPWPIAHPRRLWWLPTRHELLQKHFPWIQVLHHPSNLCWKDGPWRGFRHRCSHW